MALPCGSSTPALRVMWIVAFIEFRLQVKGYSKKLKPVTLLLPLQRTQFKNRPFLRRRLGCRSLALAGFTRQDAKAARHFPVGFFHLAQVAAEAILVHLLAGLGVPQAAAVGTDLVGQNDLHGIAFVMAAELDFEVDEAQAHTQ